MLLCRTARAALLFVFSWQPPPQGLDLLSLFESSADAMCRSEGTTGAHRALSLYHQSGASPFKIMRQLTKVARPDLAVRFATGLLGGSSRDTLPPVDRTQLADLVIQCFALAHMSAKATAVPGTAAVDGVAGGGRAWYEVLESLHQFLAVCVGGGDVAVCVCVCVCVCGCALTTLLSPDE